MSRTTRPVTVPVNRVRHAVAAAIGWGRPADTGFALAVAGLLHPPGRSARAPEVPVAAGESGNKARREEFSTGRRTGFSTGRRKHRDSVRG
ncbi:hypothetical protein RCO28_20355 [Streptomyces sp. LHD-70]|uniref:hypothetical protein n=1 Tax=Streptomyces sp. LHD-70 TaxID=3072140 RepID=UPI00280CA35F|nr:hypothetical protein [Streptomyces sp. LHD-70]MDQ8704827.1 hypothetical protein [Streptomyces sp. LHD-70]